MTRITPPSAATPNPRDNNFNLIRLLAATAVLFGHSFSLSLGSTESEPLWKTLRITPGGIAVDVFFVISGYLVTASLVSRRQVSDFLRARVLRIFPALWFATLATVFVLAPLVSLHGADKLLTEKSTLLFLAKNLTLVFGVRFTLPGVFENLPYSATINGSLWTLPIEFRLYLSLALLWWVLARLGGRLRLAPTLAALAGAMVLATLVQGENVAAGLRATALFFTGAAMQAARDRFRWSAPIFWACVAALGASSLDRAAFHWVYPVVLAYIVLYAALVPAGPIRRFNALGDYSYGVYIYAFPIQQIIAGLVPGIRPMGMFASGFICTLSLAVLSWHWIEKPALTLRSARTPLSK